MTTPRVTVRPLANYRASHAVGLLVDGVRRGPFFHASEAVPLADKLNADPHALSAFLVAWPEVK